MTLETMAGKGGSDLFIEEILFPRPGFFRCRLQQGRRPKQLAEDQCRRPHCRLQKSEGGCGSLNAEVVGIHQVQVYCARVNAGCNAKIPCDPCARARTSKSYQHWGRGCDELLLAICDVLRDDAVPSNLRQLFVSF